jgi:hypothetical protein
MKGEFWLGLILAIPLAIMGNISTRPIQNYLDSRIRSRALRRARSMRFDYAEAKQYRQHREEFYEFILESIIRLVAGVLALTTGVGAFLLLLLGIFPHVGISGVLYSSAAYLAALTIIFFAIGGLRYANDVMKIAYRVRHFSEYESRVKPTLESEEQE